MSEVFSAAMLCVARCAASNSAAALALAAFCSTSSSLYSEEGDVSVYVYACAYCCYVRGVVFSQYVTLA